MFKINTNVIPISSRIFFVGGCVRDIVLSRPPTDYDIVTLDDAEKLAQTIAVSVGSRVFELGKAKMKIFRIVAGNQTFDIARANGESIETDLSRRDFTINAMAISADTQTLIDPHNGLDDIRNTVIRMISPQNLQDDPLRLLRAYRFGSTLGFSIDRETTRAIQAFAHLINRSAGERIRDELLKLLTSTCSHEYITMMDAAGLLAALFPELIPLKTCSQNLFHQFDAFEHTLNAFGVLEKLLHAPATLPEAMPQFEQLIPKPENHVLLKYAILLHDIGKPVSRSIDKNGRIHFYYHEKTGADMASAINRRLKLSNTDRKYIDFIIRNHIRPLWLYNAHNLGRLSQKAMARFFLRCGQRTRDLLIHTAADLYGKGSNNNTRAFAEFLLYLNKCYTDSFLPRQNLPTLITGNDLIKEFELPPSPVFSKILTHVREEQISGNISSRNEAIVLVKNFLNQHNPS